MIPEFGQFAIILALCLSVTQIILPLVGAARGNIVLMNTARSTAYGQFFFLAMAMICLGYAFVTNDFSVAYVAENSNTHLPIFYRVCAIWGAHEGSMLLWIFCLTFWMGLVAWFSRSLPLVMISRVLAVLAIVTTGLLLFMLMTSNPFGRLLPIPPIQGRDLNPLLQDPGLVIHPPILYMGYVGFAVPFAFAIAALLSKKLDAVWARWSRPWTQVAWGFLTLGIVLGSWWSYRELGWGGWWSWDPVENASFLPWLTGAALIHSLAATEKRDVFKAWTVLLAIFAFALSLMGTFLVRSGVLISVHAFAVDPRRGVFLLYFLALIVGGSMLLYAIRGASIRSHSEFKLSSLETFMLGNNILLTILMLTVLLGTLYPLLMDVLGFQKLSVGPPYFNTVFVPLFIPLLFLLGFGPLARWKETPVKMLVKKVISPLIFSAILIPIILWLTVDEIRPIVTLILTLALWVILVALSEFFVHNKNRSSSKFKTTTQFKKPSRSKLGKIIAHLGIGVCVIGVTITSVYSIERDVALKPNDSVTIKSYQFKFLGMKNLKGENFKGVTAEILVTKKDHRIALLTPEKRVFASNGVALSKASLHVGLFRDLYVTLGQPVSQMKRGQTNTADLDRWSMRIYYKPFIRYIWWGGYLMLIGAAIAATDKRYRRLKPGKDTL